MLDRINTILENEVTKIPVNIHVIYCVDSVREYDRLVVCETLSSLVIVYKLSCDLIMNRKETNETGEEPHPICLSVSSFSFHSGCFFFLDIVFMAFHCRNQKSVLSRYKQMIDLDWFAVKRNRQRAKEREREIFVLMESRRGTMSSPSGTFSHIAHEALDHLVADGTHEDRNPHSIAYQPSRRRPKVSEKNPSPNIHSFTSHCLDRISSEEKGEKKSSVECQR